MDCPKIAGNIGNLECLPDSLNPFSTGSEMRNKLISDAFRIIVNREPLQEDIDNFYMTVSTSIIEEIIIFYFKNKDCGYLKTTFNTIGPMLMELKVFPLRTV